MKISQQSLSLLAVLIGVTLLYGSFSGNGFVYDDAESILAQQPLEVAGDFFQIFSEPSFPVLPYYRPVTRFTLLLQKTIHGNHAWWFHGFNALLIGVTGGLAYCLLRIPTFKIKHPPALIAAAIFVLHPAASSCVYPISSGRETLLPTAFILLSVCSFLKGNRNFYWLAVGSYAFALLSKEQAIVVPIIFVVADTFQISINSPMKDYRVWIRRYFPIATVTVVYLCIRWVLFRGTEVEVAVLGNPMQPIYSFIYALQTIFVPFVHLVYEPPQEIWFSKTRLVFSLLMLAGMIFVIVKNRESFCQPVCFWICWFFLALLPTANLLKQECMFSERYVFLAALAPVGIIAMLASHYWESFTFRKLYLIIATIVMLMLTAMSWVRGYYFENNFVFYNQWVQTNPQSENAWVHLGLEYYDQRRYSEAIGYYQKALSINSDYAGALTNMGNALAVQGQLDQAIHFYQQASENIDPQWIQQRANLYHNLGNVFLDKKDTSKAIENFQRAVELSADLYPSHLSLAEIYMQRGEPQAARKHLQTALKIKTIPTEIKQLIEETMEKIPMKNDPASK